MKPAFTNWNAWWGRLTMENDFLKKLLQKLEA